MAKLIAIGVLPPPRDLGALHGNLVDLSIARWFGEQLDLERRQPLREAASIACKKYVDSWAFLIQRRRPTKRAHDPPTLPASLEGWSTDLSKWGIVKPSRDFEALHRALQDRGLLARLGKFAGPVPLPLAKRDRAVSAVRRLVGASFSAEEL